MIENLRDQITLSLAWLENENLAILFASVFEFRLQLPLQASSRGGGGGGGGGLALIHGGRVVDRERGEGSLGNEKGIVVIFWGEKMKKACVSVFIV